MRSTLLVIAGCVVLLGMVSVGKATTTTYTTDTSVFIEWSNTDGGYANRNSKAMLKTQWSGGSNPTSIVKSYLKFPIPAGSWILNSLTLRLTTRDVGESDNNGKTLEMWALPDAYDGWSETVLDYNQAISTYANDPSGRYFTAGSLVGSGVCNAGKGVSTDFTINVSAIDPYILADTNKLITLCLPATTSTTYWCDDENGTASRRPQLTWDYTVPEPATISLLVLSGLAFIRRRK